MNASGPVVIVRPVRACLFASSWLQQSSLILVIYSWSDSGTSSNNSSSTRDGPNLCLTATRQRRESERGVANWTKRNLINN